MSGRTVAFAVIGACGIAWGAATPAAASTTTFDNGTEGWSVSGRDNISPTGGNPGANMDVEVLDVFGIQIRNETNPSFLGDYSRFGMPVTLSVDVKINSIRTVPIGNEIPRDLVLELVDYNPPGSDYPYVSVYFNFGEIGSHLPGWRNFELTIDPTQAALPAGWGGTGAEDPITFEPILPPDRTFASVLASVEEIRWTSFVPGFFYTFTDFELQVDNPTLAPIPEPASFGLFGAAGLLAMRRRRA